MTKIRRCTVLLTVLAVCLSLWLTACSGSGNKTVPEYDDSVPKNEITVTRSDKSSASHGKTKLYELTELCTYSPSGNIIARFWADENNGMYYSVEADNEQVIEPSKLGMTLANCDFSSGITEITAYDRPETVRQSYETCLTISLEEVSCEDYCSEREIFIKKGEAGLTIVVRVYDDGFAFRYKDVDSGKKGRVFVTNEATTVELPQGSITFAGGYSATYEFDYIERSYSELEKHGGVFNTPMTAKVGKHWMLLSESDVYANDISYIKSVLETNGGSAVLRWQFGFRRDPVNEVTDDLASPGHIRISELTLQNGFTTPWRAAIIASDLDGLINSSLIDSLCPEMDEKLFSDTSWIKPGKVSWSWWSGGDQHNYDVQVDHVNFSSRNGWEYCCLDAGWPSFENRMPELCEYAKSKNVGIILWVNYLHLKSEKEIEKLFSKWSEWGVVGVKTDYFESDDIEVLESMRNVAEIAAKYKLMVYYHGCINPCGETRTYPNIMTSEAVLGEEFRKWSEAPSARNCLMYPFTRNITGSMDYTPSCIAIEKTGESAGFSLAKSVVYESAFQHFASSCYSFRGFLGLELLSRMPTAWVKTTVIDGYPGSHITLVRSDGEDYYIGSMTIDKRDVIVSLDFLGEGEYNAYVYSDDNNGRLVLESKKVKKGDELKLGLGKIGGAVVLVTKDDIG